MKRFSEEQIIGFLREAEKGVPMKELCRNQGFSESMLENEVIKETLQNNGNRLGASRAGAVDASARGIGTTLPGDRRHERAFVAL